MSGRKFASALDLSSTTVNQYLNGRTPPADFIVLVCERFPNVDPWWLMTGQGKAPESKPMDPQIMEVVSIMERLDDKGKADLVRVAEKEELLADIKKSRGLKPIGEAGVIGVNLLIQLLLPTELILVAVGYGWINGDTAWELLSWNKYYWALALPAVFIFPVQAIRWLKRRESSVVIFKSRRFGRW
ncbi:MAG TPA: helix-turn-helix transcriptional regulator [Desulfuromonadales bacterium]|nr:helix-turn-helix transcriptional regulator [Desulfuromonadales bacterium]